MVRIQVTLDSGEAHALAQWARAELREPRDQIRYIVREALEKREDVTQLEAQQQRPVSTSRGQHADRRNPIQYANSSNPMHNPNAHGLATVYGRLYLKGKEAEQRARRTQEKQLEREPSQ